MASWPSRCTRPRSGSQRPGMTCSIHYCLQMLHALEKKIGVHFFIESLLAGTRLYTVTVVSCLPEVPIVRVSSSTHINTAPHAAMAFSHILLCMLKHDCTYLYKLVQSSAAPPTKHRYAHAHRVIIVHSGATPPPVPYTPTQFPTYVCMCSDRSCIVHAILL